MDSQGDSVSHDNFLDLETSLSKKAETSRLNKRTSLSKKAETSRLNKRKGKDPRNEGTSLPPVKLLRQQFPPQNQFQNQQFPYPNQYSNQPFPYPNQFSNQQFPPQNQFQNQQFPYPNQYSNQQFSPQNQFQNKQFPHPNQYSNQQFPPQNQFQNQQLPYPNQYSNQQFPPQNQFQNQQFPYPNQYSNQQFPYPNQNSNQQFSSQNQYSNQQFVFPSTRFQTQSHQYTNMLNQPFSQNPNTKKTLNPKKTLTLSRTNPRSPRSPESPPINDEVEVVKVTKEVRLFTLFTKVEDICLARAYVRGTKDPTTGKDQKFAVHWNEIKLHYNELAATKGLKPRKAKSLKNRMTRMKGEMMMYNEAITHVESTYHSGCNEAMKMTKVNEKFKQLNKKFKNASFKFQHVVDILNQCSKFIYVTRRSNIPRYEGTNSSSSNDSRGTPNIGSHASTEQSREYHTGDKRPRCSVEVSEEVSSPTHPSRSIGNKAAKLQANRGKCKVGAASNQSLNVLSDLSHERAIYYQEKLSLKKQAHAEKIKVLQEAVDNEERKIELERDMRIMSIDVNSLASEMEKEQMLNLRSKILAKWE